jgi:hypothetical protein
LSGRCRCCPDGSRCRVSNSCGSSARRTGWRWACASGHYLPPRQVLQVLEEMELRLAEPLVGCSGLGLAGVAGDEAELALGGDGGAGGCRRPAGGRWKALEELGSYRLPRWDVKMRAPSAMVQQLRAHEALTRRLVADWQQIGVLERMARGAGAARWFLVTSMATLERVFDLLRGGSSVSVRLFLVTHHRAIQSLRWRS